MVLLTVRDPEKLPFKRTKVVWEGYANLDTYLHELLDVKKAAIAAGLAEKDALDLMGVYSKNPPPQSTYLPSTPLFPLLAATNTTLPLPSPSHHRQRLPSHRPAQKCPPNLDPNRHPPNPRQRLHLPLRRPRNHRQQPNLPPHLPRPQPPRPAPPPTHPRRPPRVLTPRRLALPVHLP